MDAPLRQILDELRTRLEAIYGPRLERVILYGSHARGEARRDSDVDVMIVLSGQLDHWKEIQRTSAMTAEVSIKYGIAISRMFATSAEAEAETEPFYANVRREGVVV